MRQGHDVTTFQRRPSGVDGARDFCGSLTDAEALRRAVEGAEGIIHLAAKVSFTGRAAEFDQVNVEGTRRLLDAARAAGVRDVVYVSSPSVANSGAAIAGLGAEPADPERAHGHYSRTKAEAELLALAADAPEFRVAAMRPHIVWGAFVIELLAENGLRRGKNGLEVIMMCELPSNALLADEFLDYFDGFSIGSNDMTQLALGLDRDSAIVSAGFDERDPAVKKLLSMAIRACRERGKYVGVCGQGPSDHPDLAEWLVDQGIDSVSLNPDTVVDTWLRLADVAGSVSPGASSAAEALTVGAR